MVGLIAAILWQMLLLTHQSGRCPGCWTVLVEVWIIAVLGQRDVDQRSEKLLCSGKLSVEEFLVVFQITQ